MTKRRFDKAVQHDGSGLNLGGPRVSAMAKRLRQMKARHDAGLDPFAGPRAKMPTNPDRNSSR